MRVLCLISPKTGIFLQADRFEVHVLPQDHGSSTLGNDFFDCRGVTHPCACEMGDGGPGEDLRTHESRRSENDRGARFAEACPYFIQRIRDNGRTRNNGDAALAIPCAALSPG